MPTVPKSSGGSGGSSKDAKTKPSTPSDMRLRIKHSKDSVTYNKAHAADHTVAAAKAQKQVKATVKLLKKTTGK